MPRTAVANSHEREVTPTTLDRLLERGRAQGRLSLSELREAFAEAGVSPVEGRSILRELTEAGVNLAAENEPGLTAGARTSTQTSGEAPGRAPARKSRRAAQAAAQAAGDAPARGGAAKKRTAKASAADTTAGTAAEEPFDEEVAGAEAETEAADNEPLDLDDTSSVMGDSVHTYLKSIGRRLVENP
ncbi:RNA polymerase sigma factor, partial [Microbispora tritici]